MKSYCRGENKKLKRLKDIKNECSIKPRTKEKTETETESTFSTKTGVSAKNNQNQANDEFFFPKAEQPGTNFFSSRKEPKFSIKICQLIENRKFLKVCCPDWNLLAGCDPLNYSFLVK